MIWISWRAWPGGQGDRIGSQGHLPKPCPACDNWGISLHKVCHAGFHCCPFAIMILGIGTDLCNIERIEGTLARFGERFLMRVFTELEQRKANSRPRAIAATYAKRWAAKEACSKALGTGLRMGISWKDMAVSNLRTGQPVMHVTGWAKERLDRMTPPGFEAIIHVTLTDDHPWAQAFVVIEARPLN